MIPARLRHSRDSIMSSPRFTRSGAMSFFAELKARSHSQDVAGQNSVSNAYWWIFEYVFCIASHHETVSWGAAQARSDTERLLSPIMVVDTHIRMYETALF